MIKAILKSLIRRELVSDLVEIGATISFDARLAFELGCRVTSPDGFSTAADDVNFVCSSFGMTSGMQKLSEEESDQSRLTFILHLRRFLRNVLGHRRVSVSAQANSLSRYHKYIQRRSTK
jgi:hypothetical protein